MKEDHETNQFIISLYAFNSSLLNVVVYKLKKKIWWMQSLCWFRQSQSIHCVEREQQQKIHNKNRRNRLLSSIIRQYMFVLKWRAVQQQQKKSFCYLCLWFPCRVSARQLREVDAKYSDARLVWMKITGACQNWLRLIHDARKCVY